MSKTTGVVDVLIENITTDQKLLEEVEQKVQKAKDQKKEVADRLKGYRNDLSVLLKYADETQQKKIEELGLSSGDQTQGLNPVASTVIELLAKAKNHTMTNGELYDAYVKTVKDQEDVESYTHFNIKCRSLFNSQRLIRKKAKDSKSSRDDIISVNGGSKPDTDKETTPES
ncbi:MAG: hypothetical protein CMI36_00360 [Owenweeksia sp.]|nr:hypothetical protein [Owenweeksia sp.]MBF97417.1 hypothetical protein [Owenweeksia sp.]HBF20744.1 hypothetical protein [Cryomorphaceae bacterium]|tara:strand:+ start:1378 stop:1890 length:513 start_codon:yes stop_codon:yes gene_type:complete